MKRRPHYLKTVAGGEIPRSFLSLAAVPRDDGKVEWCLRHYDRENHEDAYLDGMSGTDVKALWSTLALQTKDGYPTWLMMFGAVDQLGMLGFWELLNDETWTLKPPGDASAATDCGNAGRQDCGLCILEDAPTIIQAFPAGSSRPLKILDCRNYGVQCWRSLADGNLPATDSRGEAAAKAAYIDRFVRQLTALVHTANLGSLKATAASQAMHSFKHRFMRGMILVHNDTDAICLERASLYAGRCECWHVNRPLARLYHLDFNAHYPSVTADAPMPTRFKRMVEGCSPNPLQLATEGWCVISEVTVETDTPIYPLRFSRRIHTATLADYRSGELRHWPRDGDVVYPVGRFRTSLCWPELQKAFSNEHVRLVHRTAVYEPSVMFADWSRETAVIEKWVKAHAVMAVAEFVKRWRNSLYGKFAQWLNSWEPAPWEASVNPFDCWYGRDPDTGDLCRYRSIARYVQQERRLGESFESCPAITAWVYSLARAKLWQAIEVAGKENVFYMDTDSLWVNHDGFTALNNGGWISQTEPGKLKIEAMHAEVVFHGLKNYQADLRRVAAGVPVGLDGTFVSGWRWKGKEKVMPALLRQHSPGEREIVNVVNSVSGYRHGRVLTGGKVVPHTITE